MSLYTADWAAEAGRDRQTLVRLLEVHDTCAREAGKRPGEARFTKKGLQLTVHPPMS